MMEHPMSRALLRLLSCIFQSGKIPSSWNSSLLISIPKKGDLKDMNNYRGISLISTIVKLLSAIVTNRIRYTVESHASIFRGDNNRSLYPLSHDLLWIVFIKKCC